MNDNERTPRPPNSLVEKWSRFVEGRRDPIWTGSPKDDPPSWFPAHLFPARTVQRTGRKKEDAIYGHIMDDRNFTRQDAHGNPDNPEYVVSSKGGGLGKVQRNPAFKLLGWSKFIQELARAPGFTDMKFSSGAGRGGYSFDVWIRIFPGGKGTEPNFTVWVKWLEGRLFKFVLYGNFPPGQEPELD